MLGIDAFKVRPFDEFFETGPQMPMLPIVGRIENDCFVVSAFGQRVVLETVEVGEDQWGPFAVVSEHKAPLVDGFIFQASVEHEEDEEPGGCICVFIEGEHREEARRLLVERGFDPEKAIILIVRERVFSVYFHNSGVVNGRGSVGGPVAADTTVN